ncbi:MAG: hypothetical protein ACRD8A_18505 [Candidatus Acidiferrales bacterium]
MVGLDDFFSAIALGTTLVQQVMKLKKRINGLRSTAVVEDVRPDAVDALDRRVDALERLTRRQAVVMKDLEIGLEDASAVTESLARRVRTIFWIAVPGGIAALSALAISIAGLVLRR